jgi:hypothetical protein
VRQGIDATGRGAAGLVVAVSTPRDQQPTTANAARAATSSGLASDQTSAEEQNLALKVVVHVAAGSEPVEQVVSVIDVDRQDPVSAGTGRCPAHPVRTARSSAASGSPSESDCAAADVARAESLLRRGHDACPFLRLFTVAVTNHQRPGSIDVPARSAAAPARGLVDRRSPRRGRRTQSWLRPRRA